MSGFVGWMVAAVLWFLGTALAGGAAVMFHLLPDAQGSPRRRCLTWMLFWPFIAVACAIGVVLAVNSSIVWIQIVDRTSAPDESSRDEPWRQ